MRWLLGRDAGTCHACGADLVRGAAWCGGCGARADGGGDADQEAVAEAAADSADPVDEPSDPPLARRALAAAVVLALVALAVAWQLRSPVPEPLLGHLGQSTGMSATGPPPSGLRPAWSHEPPSAVDRRLGGSPPVMVARGDRIRVGNRVVDPQGGQLVGLTPDMWQAAGTQRTIIDGPELLVVDTLSGVVRSRATLADELQDAPLWGGHRGLGASLVGVEQDSVLVADDGSMVAEVEGRFLDYVDRAWQDPAAFPVRGRVTEDELSTPLRLVRAATGQVVVDLPERRTRVADVSGDLAMVAGTDAAVDPYHAPLDAEDVEWSVALLDARTGEERVQLTATSREPPRLVGTFGDGTAVVTTRIGDEHQLLAVTPVGEVSTIAHIAQLPHQGNSGLIIDSTALSAAAMAGDVLAVASGDGEVVALDRAGSRLWELDAPGTAGVRGSGGYLALVHGDDRRIRLVRATDGEVVATLAPAEEPWMVADTVGLPVGAIGGHVGIGRPGHYLTPRQGPLAETTWLDLRTGETATPRDVFGPFAGDEEPGPDWVLHGIVTDERGEPEPVFSRTQPQDGFELLDPGEGFRSHRLSLPPTGGAPGFAVASAGASSDHFAAWHEGVRDPADMATVVLDRTSGASTTVEGVRGVLLLGDVLLAEEIGQSYTMTALVAVDPATGEERWRAEPHARHPGQEPLLADDELLIDAGVARVTARSTQAGTQLWSHASDVELSGDTVLGPDHVVVATTDGELVALDRRDGTVAWRTGLGTPVASLTGAGDHVLAGTHDGLVVHLDGRGREVQRIAVGTGGVHEVAALGETVVAIVDDRLVGLRVDGNGIMRDEEVELP